MTATAQPPNRPKEPNSRRSPGWVWVAAASAAAVSAVVLWHWLELLALPLAVATSGLIDLDDQAPESPPLRTGPSPSEDAPLAGDKSSPPRVSEH